MGIVNHELETVEYTVEARLDGDPAAVRIAAAEGSARQAGQSAFVVGPLADEEKWEQPVQVTALTTGERMKLAFLLFSPRPRDGYHLRALLGEAYFSSQGAQGRERSLEFALRHRGSADGRITTALAPWASA